MGSWVGMKEDICWAEEGSCSRVGSLQDMKVWCS